MSSQGEQNDVSSECEAGDADLYFFDASAYGFGPEDEDPEVELSWRLNEADSLSDWKIIVTRLSSKNSPADTYHVHKNILAVGRNKSEYFASLFKSSNSSLPELSDATSRIELEDSAADAFPLMLDFIYGDEKATVTTESAVALRHLAQYFQIRQLFVEATAFIRKDWSERTLPFYLSQATLYYDDKLAKAAADGCAEKLIDIERDLIVDLSPKLFLMVLASEKINAIDSLALSRIVSTYCDTQSNELDEDMFGKMTDESIMPTVDLEVAMPLLKMHLKLRGDNEDNNSHETARSIKSRCLETLSAKWQLLAEAPSQDRDASQDGEKEGVIAHHDLPPLLQVELLEECLHNAKKSEASMVSFSTTVLKSFLQQNEKLRKENALLRDKNSKLEDKNSELEASNDRLMSSYMGMSNSYHSLQYENNRLSDTVSRQENTMNGLRGNIKGLHRKLRNQNNNSNYYDDYYDDDYYY